MRGLLLIVLSLAWSVAALSTMMTKSSRGVETCAWRDASSLKSAVVACEDPELSGKISKALRVLGDALRIFGDDAVYCSFNGGKDAVVILHLLRCAVAARQQAGDKKAALLYFDATDDFDEMREFVARTVTDFAEGDDSEFHIETIQTEMGFVDGLKVLVKAAEPRPLAFVLGTRRADPNCGDQQAFEPSSDWMPAFMRVNPILDWTYGDVWNFLRMFDIPYCRLYDEGYTSLGTRSTTDRNPQLARGDGTYGPAYELTDWTAERAGRRPKAPK